MYPSYDFTRPTFHASKTAIKPKTKRDERFTDVESQTASTAATTVIDKKKGKDQNFGSPQKGVTIAKISNLSDAQLERLLRAKFRSNAENFTQNVIRDVRFTAVEKNVHGTKIKPKET